MIDLYTWSTPNGRKVSIMLEECDLPYEVHAIDISKGQQHDPEFLRLSPNNKIPAILDRDAGIGLFESGAILIYLAEKTGRFLPQGHEPRLRTLEWLMWQMGSVGPMFGQAHHFLKFNPGRSAYAEERFKAELERLYRVLEARLAGRPWLAGEDYTIADIATWPWIARYEWHGIDWADYPKARAWYERIAARPAVRRGYDVPQMGHTIPA